MFTKLYNMVKSIHNMFSTDYYKNVPSKDIYNNHVVCIPNKRKIYLQHHPSRFTPLKIYNKYIIEREEDVL